MNDVLFPDSWWLVSRARGAGAVLRFLVLVGPAAAVGCAWIAAGHTIPLLDLLIMALAVVCVVLPDSHFGLLVVGVIAIEWLATVHDRTTPWSIGAAASLALFHASLAAATVAPPAATWTRAMCRRWLRRGVVVIATSAFTWAVVAVIHGRHIAGGALLVTASLLALAGLGLWARNGSFDAGVTDPEPMGAP